MSKQAKPENWRAPRWLLIMSMSLLGICFTVASLSVAWQWFIQRPMQIPESGAVVEFVPGENVTQFAHMLNDKHYINRPSFFIWLARLTGQDKVLRAGEYTLTPGMTPGQLLHKMVNGDVKRYYIRIGEGWTFAQIREVLLENNDLIKTIQDLNDDELKSSLNIDYDNLEGLFFPETYQFIKGTRDIDILERAQSKMDSNLQLVWEQNPEQQVYWEDPYQALIAASIVEKETGVISEKPMVAGVIVRRLDKNMRLQVDPTVIYGMGSDYQGVITRSDLQNPTPYNTYRINGLPPTPISTVSLTSLEAVMNPDDGNTLYFVSKGDGSHYFSETLEEHNQAVRQYLKRD